MEHLNLKTKSNSEFNLEALYQICPACFTEVRDETTGELHRVVDFDKLKSFLGEDVAENVHESYEFTWVGKQDARREAAKPITKTLRPYIEESVDWDTTKNLYIEGDNLEVLKLLQNSYMGKVKMIYIDPPYNTGNDFIYHDDFTQDRSEYDLDAGNVDEEGNRFRKNAETNGRFHSDWCSMIYSRLLLARNLLSEDGVIFISIDDCEQQNLKNITNEIFGEKNFVAQLVWEKKKKGAFLSKNYINMKEYLIVYAKNNSKFNGLIGEINNTTETYPCIKTTNARGIRVIRAGTPSKYKELNYSLPAGTRISSGNMELIFLDDLEVSNGKLTADIRIDSNWIYSQEALDTFADNNLIYITQDNYIRRIVTEKRTKKLKDLLNRVGNDQKVLTTYEYDSNLNNGGWGTNEDANDELHQLLGHQYIFDFSKPTRLIAKLIQSASDPDSIILDFFSGSSSTADAVMQINAADNGTRQFIMVQLPEKTTKDSPAYKAGYVNICEIGKERIRRAGTQIKEKHNDTNCHIDVGFRVLKCDESNMKDVYFEPKDLQQQDLINFMDNIKEDRTDLDLLFDCMLKWGIQLSEPIEKKLVGESTIYNVNDGDLIACFSQKVTREVIDQIADWDPLRVIFRDGSFEEISEKMNLFEIFKQKCDWSDEEVRKNVRMI